MTEAEYWQRRIDRLYDKHHANVKVKQIYRQAYRKLERNIIKLYNELQNTGELTTTQLYQYHRFLALRREIKKQCGQINTTLQDRVTYTLTQAYKATFGLAVELLDSDLHGVFRTSVWFMRL